MCMDSFICHYQKKIMRRLILTNNTTLNEILTQEYHRVTIEKIPKFYDNKLSI